MRFSVLAMLVAAVVVCANPLPQGVTSAISPTGTMPAGCSTTHTSAFGIAVEKIDAVNKLDGRGYPPHVMSAPRSLSSRASDLPEEGADSILVMTLRDGVLVDGLGRTGYIASNYQFQFDDPAQAGALYTSGWSTCEDGTLALGSSKRFWQCLSGGFYNLYDRDWAAQCEAIELAIFDVAVS